MGTYTFDSIAKFANAARHTHTYKGGGYRSKRWNDGMSHDESYRMALAGDDSLVADAEAMLEQIDATVEVPIRQWVPSVYGAYPVVPEFLAGSPTCMRHVVNTATEYSPMAIWVDLNCSGGFSAQELLVHGTAILALLLKLQQTRPIELKLVCALPTRKTRIVVNVNSKPLSVSEACFGLCKVAFCRNLMFGYAEKVDKGWTDRIIDTERELRTFVGVPESDLLVKGPHLNDPIMNDPIAWVNKQVKIYTEGEEN